MLPAQRGPGQGPRCQRNDAEGEDVEGEGTGMRWLLLTGKAAPSRDGPFHQEMQVVPPGGQGHLVLNRPGKVPPDGDR